MQRNEVRNESSLNCSSFHTDLDCLLVEVMVATETHARHAAMLSELLKKMRKSAEKQNTSAACNYGKFITYLILTRVPFCKILNNLEAFD